MEPGAKKRSASSSRWCARRLFTGGAIVVFLRRFCFIVGLFELRTAPAEEGRQVVFALRRVYRHGNHVRGLIGFIDLLSPLLTSLSFGPQPEPFPAPDLA